MFRTGDLRITPGPPDSDDAVAEVPHITIVSTTGHEAAYAPAVSKTTTMELGDRLFWALDDAFGVWLAYLVEEIDRAGPEPGTWLAELAEDWRVATSITDFGGGAREVTDEQAHHLHALAISARRSAVACGDVPVERLRAWTVAKDLPVADGVSRTGDRVELNRILEVADGFIALASGTFPPDPPGGAWFLGTGQGYAVIEYRT